MTFDNTNYSSKISKYQNKKNRETFYKIDKDYVYYFDQYGIWCRKVLEPGKEYSACLPVPFENWNVAKQKSALEQLKIGDTLDRFRELYALEGKKYNLPEGLERFIGKVEVFIERENGNLNLDTFDFVRVYAYTTFEPEGGKRIYIKNNIDDINRFVIKKLEKNRIYQSYGVPIHFLKLTNITITAHDDIAYIFELKHSQKEREIIEEWLQRN